MSRRPRRKSDHSSEAFRPVRIGRNVFPVIGRVRIRNRTYLLLKRLSPAPRERFLAFDPHAGPRGALRAVHCVPRTPAAVQHVKVLGRLPHGWPLPFLLDYEDDGESVRLALDWVEGIDLRSYLDRIRCGRTVPPSPSIAVRWSASWRTD